MSAFFHSHRSLRLLLSLSLLCATAAVQAQWLDYPTPGIARKADGTPDLSAPAPRTPAGRPDFSGIWFANVPSKDFCSDPQTCIQEERIAREQINWGTNMEGGLPYSDWSLQQMVPRRANGGREDPHAYCMPPNYPRAWTLPQYMKIVQTPELMVMLHEFNAAYRQVFMDGRPLPEDPNPTWNGYSIAHWEGDTLVIETNGIRDDMWLDIQGSPITEAALVTERLTRHSYGIMEVALTVDDPLAYTRPWTVSFEMAIQPDTMILDEICLDNEQDTEMYQ